MKAFIFAYGTLVLPQYLKRFEASVINSVFLRGYKVICESYLADYMPAREFDKCNEKYNFLKLVPTGNNDDIVAGFQLGLPEWQIAQMDIYEGEGYKRVDVTAFTRQGEAIPCETYIKA